MSIVKVVPFMRGVPEGGVNGQVLVRDDASSGGMKWSSSVSLASDRIAKTPVEAIAIPNDGNGDRFSVRINGTAKLQVKSSEITTTVPINGRTLSTDGQKLDGIQANAQRNPTQVSSPEKTSPSGVTSVRGFSPKDVLDMINTHGGSGSGSNYPQVTSAEIGSADTVTDLRSFAPSDVHGIVSVFATGEENPDRVTSGQLSNPSVHTAVRSFSPSDINTLVNNKNKSKSSPQYTLSISNGNHSWTHGEASNPTIVQVYAVCVSSAYGYSVGDRILLAQGSGTTLPTYAKGVQISFNSSGTSLIIRYADRPSIIEKSSFSSVEPSPSFFKLQVKATWIL